MIAYASAYAHTPITDANDRNDRSRMRENGNNNAKHTNTYT